MNDVPNDHEHRTHTQAGSFINDINRAVAEWLRGVANELDPPRCPDGVSVVSDDGADVADALDADGGVVVAGKGAAKP